MIASLSPSACLFVRLNLILHSKIIQTEVQANLTQYRYQTA